ncbi:MAG TPA: tetraacyldisaccharide 4'-kinase [Methylomirabilota bacterium]|nr:tetraacyldisaccharide 4'-kinase [Methylomirabilota bacterium]
MLTPRRDPEMLLRKWWEEGAPRPVAAGLAVLSVGYRLGLAARERAYGWGLLRTGRLPCPVISVGNITLGGSGKTPTVELVVLALRELGATPAVVSRGYGRLSRGVEVAADRDGVRLDAHRAGDEPLMLAERLPGTPVVVGENRFEAGQIALERCGATVVVLDDAYQNRTVHKDLEILVLNGRAPWGNGRLFPRGTLREPLAALARADLVVVTNGTDVDARAVGERLGRHNRRAPVIRASYHVTEARDGQSGRRAEPRTLAGRRLLAFCGLGSPRSFADTLLGLGARVSGIIEFPDHYWYTAADLDGLTRQATAMGAELVTTEKDWMRLRSLGLPQAPLWVVPVRLTLETGHEEWIGALGRTLVSSGIRHS